MSCKLLSNSTEGISKLSYSTNSCSTNSSSACGFCFMFIYTKTVSCLIQRHCHGDFIQVWIAWINRLVLTCEEVISCPDDAAWTLLPTSKSLVVSTLGFSLPLSKPLDSVRRKIEKIVAEQWTKWNNFSMHETGPFGY